jgi:excisionase family DNA binding protein
MNNVVGVPSQAALRRGGGSLVFLTLSREVAGHLCLAVQGHRQWAQLRGMAIPDELADLERQFQIQARQGQAGTAVEKPGAALEAEQVSPRLLTYADAAALLHVGERTIKRLVAAGALSPLRIGGSVRLRLSDIDAYIERLAAPSPTPKDVA